MHNIICKFLLDVIDKKALDSRALSMLWNNNE